jgi:hypothetical protein
LIGRAVVDEVQLRVFGAIEKTMDCLRKDIRVSLVGDNGCAKIFHEWLLLNLQKSSDVPSTHGKHI